MPYTQQGLPYAGSTPLSRQHSLLAAQAVASTRGPKKRSILAYLDQVLASTDAGIAEACRLPLSSVCALRNGLVESRAVRAVGRMTGRYGHPVTLWALAAKADRAVAAYERQALLTDRGELADLGDVLATPIHDDDDQEALCCF